MPQAQLSSRKSHPPFPIAATEHGCGDCYDYRTSLCFQECEYNSGYELVHPCDGCNDMSTEYCFLECPYNQDWQLQNPCNDCQRSECSAKCRYYQKRQEGEAN